MVRQPIFAQAHPLHCSVHDADFVHECSFAAECLLCKQYCALPGHCSVAHVGHAQIQELSRQSTSGDSSKDVDDGIVEPSALAQGAYWFDCHIMEARWQTALRHAIACVQLLIPGRDVFAIHVYLYTDQLQLRPHCPRILWLF